MKRRRQNSNPEYSAVLSLAKPWSLIVLLGFVGAVWTVSVALRDSDCLITTARPITRATTTEGLVNRNSRDHAIAHDRDRVLVLDHVDIDDQDVAEEWTVSEYLPDVEKNHTDAYTRARVHTADAPQPTSNGGSSSSGSSSSSSSSGNQKALFPLASSDYWGFFCACVGLMVAAGGGIGGGGILVPIFILVMGFSPKHGIALSSITVFGGSLANTLLSCRKRHPLADRPLVDWDLILVMEPLTIAGTLIGAFLNKLLPELLLTSLLVLLLSVTAWESISKAIKMYQKETLELQTLSDRPDAVHPSEVIHIVAPTAKTKENTKNYSATETFCGESDESTCLDDEFDTNSGGSSSGDDEQAKLPEQLVSPIIHNMQTSSQSLPQNSFAINTIADRSDELCKILHNERFVPKDEILTLVVMLFVVLAVNILKGGGAFPSPLGIVCGSTIFWLANLFMICWILGVAAFVRQKLVQQWELKRRVGFPYVEGDIQWCPRATIIYPLVCCFAGFFAGMFGVGGGIVQGPLLLTMGVHPVVASATLAYLVLFTAFTATTSFAVFGLLLPDYALVCFLTGFFATCAGQAGLGYLMKKAQRNSYIAFSIGTVVFVSAILMTIESLLSIMAGKKHHSGSICGRG